MSVVFLILKIIGLILLAVVLLILAALLLVLFVPVRYHVRGSIDEDVFVRVKASWLLSIITYHMVYENGSMERYMKIFGIRKRKSKPVSEEELAEDLERAEEEFEQDVEETETEEKLPLPVTKVEAPEEVNDAVSADPGDTDRTEVSDGQRERKHVDRREVSDGRREPTRRKFFQKLSDKIRELKAKIKAFWTKLKQTFRKVLDIKNMITDETNKRAVLYVLAELKYLLTHFRFRKIDTDLRFSLGDPAITGQALGVMSMLPFLYRYAFRIYPDFEADEAYVKGTFEIKGRIRMVHVAVSIVRLLKKREVRILVKQIMKGR